MDLRPSSPKPRAPLGRSGRERRSRALRAHPRAAHQLGATWRAADPCRCGGRQYQRDEDVD
jgi:hypothetical protein